MCCNLVRTVASARRVLIWSRREFSSFANLSLARRSNSSGVSIVRVPRSCASAKSSVLRLAPAVTLYAAFC
jgi:hypothetical protein